MRLISFSLIIFLISTIIIGRLFFIQVKNFDVYTKQAEQYQNLVTNIEPERGDIFFRNKFEETFLVATNKHFYRVYAVPSKIKPENQDKIVDILTKNLDLDKDFVMSRIVKENDPYEPIKDGLEEKSIVFLDEINKINKGAVGKEVYLSRFYPLNNIASHVIGFTDKDKLGIYGIEKYYNDILSGSPGIWNGIRDTFGQLVKFKGGFTKNVTPGDDLVLTIDYNIQLQTEKVLEDIIEKCDASGGSIIVLDPNNGDILSMTSKPDFDLNNYSQKKPNLFLNPVVQSLFEPGSIFKPITMAAGLDKGVITARTKYLDKGFIEKSGYTIRNSDEKAHGEQNMIDVLALSLNTGAVFVQDQLEKNVFKNYIEKFEFGQKTGIDISGELSGNIVNLDTMRDINYATASYGQGISVTPIQMITSFSAIALNGNLIKPHIADKIIYSDGSINKIEQNIFVKSVIAPDTAATLTAMLVNSLEKGYAKKGKVDGYILAGKTGTAQVPDLEKGGYLKDKTIHTFLGFGPAFEPKFIILIKLDYPQGINFASDSIGPSFSKLAKFILDYYQIPPTNSQ